VILDQDDATAEHKSESCRRKPCKKKQNLTFLSFTMPSFWQDIDDDLCMDVVPCSDTHSFTTDLTEERQYESDAESFASSFAPLPSFIISTQFSTFNSPTLDSALLPWDSRHPPPFQQPPFNNPSTFTTPGRVFRSREVEDAFLSDIGSLGMMVPKGMADRLKLRDGVGGPIYIPSDFTASDGNVDSGSPEGWRPRSVLGTDSVDPIVFGAEDEMDVDDDEDMAEEEDERVEDIHVVIDESMAEDEPMLDSAVELNDEVIVPEQDKQVLIKTEELPVQVMESIEEPREPKLFPCPCGQTFERLCGIPDFNVERLKISYKNA
jgi:hypothetical protein